MALRTFQFCIVFTIGICWGPAIVSAVAAVGTEITLSLGLQDPHDVIVGRGQPATLRCNVSSTEPDVQVSWLHGNVTIAANDSRRQMQEDGRVLYIRKVAAKRGNSLEGEYRCLARNKIGALLSNPARLKTATMSKEFLTLPENKEVSEGQPVVLPCSIQSTPAAKITWKRHNLSLPHNTRYVPLPSGDLLIISTHSSDSGPYKCVAVNEILKKPRHSKAATLTVLSPSLNPQTPEFLHLGETNLTALVGSNLSLFCAVKGNPAPKIQWLNNSSLVVGNTTELRLQNITADLAGEYRCIAHNSGGKISQKYFVEIQQPPYFLKKPTSKTYPSARTVRLECNVSGLPQPKVHWLKDGVPLISDSWRIKEQPTELVLSHSFTTDAGIYQCVATNTVGMAWAAAQVIPKFSETRPSPPINVQCRSYDETSICLHWQAPPNVTVQAYNVYSYHSDPSSEKKKIRGPEYLTNVTYKLAEGLRSGTNHSFYVRVYSMEASDQSTTVTCETVAKGERNLQIQPVSSTTVRVAWSGMSSDVPCYGSATYKVQWRKRTKDSVNVAEVSGYNITLSGLTPSTTYEFRVQSMTNQEEDAPWTPYTLSNHSLSNDTHNINSITHNLYFNESNYNIAIPEQLEAKPSSSNSINLKWFDLRDIENFNGYFTICYKEVQSAKTCENVSSLLNSSSNKIEISGLKPYTLYEFKVQFHAANGLISQFSHAIECRTLADVPMPVQDLNWNIENTTTVCLKWRSPEQTNGPLKKYVISYTPDHNRPLEHWLSITIPAKQNLSNMCWLSGVDTVSTRLYSLETDAKYTVVVRAATDAGLGNPTIPLTLFTRGISTVGSTGPNPLPPDNRDDLHENQQLGIFIGVTVALVCIIACVSCMLVRRRCIKNQALVEARTSAGNVPNGPLTTTPNTNVIQLRMLQDTCTAEAHEMQCLMQSDITTPHIPPLRNVHLDTKGGIGYPNTNGQLNGLKHSIYTNGHIGNGQVHITENPRYDAIECNGNSNKRRTDARHLYCCQSDSLHCTKSSNQSPNQSLNCTQLTCLEDTLPVVPPSPRRISPALGPNG